ncbi:toll-like receptor Tollo [Sesbania bispinosa]|nr:toll-like receptor Tollo [Sesbania bispinosa]
MPSTGEQGRDVDKDRYGEAILSFCNRNETEIERFGCIALRGSTTAAFCLLPRRWLRRLHGNKEGEDH